MEKQQKIVLTGGPGTGKTSIINQLIQQGHCCLEEVSRQVTQQAQAQGIDQLFLTEPLLFSQKLLEGRLAQYKELHQQADTLFFDRGIPDVIAYLKYAKLSYPDSFNQTAIAHPYDQVFILPPWEAIYKIDSERYENFQQAQEIHQHIEQTYAELGYQAIEVPTGTVQQRIDFICAHL